MKIVFQSTPYLELKQIQILSEEKQFLEEMWLLKRNGFWDKEKNWCLKIH